MTIEEELAALRSDPSAKWGTESSERVRRVVSAQAQHEASLYLANSIRIGLLEVALAIRSIRSGGSGEGTLDR